MLDVSRKLEQTAATPRRACTILAAGSARGQAQKALACLRSDSVRDDGAASRVRGCRRRTAPALDPTPPSHTLAAQPSTGANHALTNTSFTLTAYAAGRASLLRQVYGSRSFIVAHPIRLMIAAAP